MREKPGRRIPTVLLVRVVVPGLLLVSGCTPPPASVETTALASVAATEASGSGAFSAGPCAFALPNGVEPGDDVTCGYLTVPERHEATSTGNTRTIRLAVAIFRGGEVAERRVPVMYLSGGPGASALESLRYGMPEVFDAILAAGHDVVVFDQRGVGRSRPAMDCPEADEASRDLIDRQIDGETVSKDAALQLMVEAFDACGQRLGKTVDLTAYNSAESARDVADLAKALGYERVSLWGGSYGTRLALEVMRQLSGADGGWLESVVLDSVYPPDVDLYAEAPANFERSLERLFESCAANSVCNSNYPDLRDTFFDTVEQLNREPGHSALTDFKTGDEIPAEMDGDVLVAMVFQLLYSTEVKLLLPELIQDASVGDFAALDNFRSSLLMQQSTSSRGMMFSVQCNEEIAFSSPDAVQDIEMRYPELVGTFAHGLMGDLAYRVCERWDAGHADPSANEPVYSDIPTLIMTGEFDPITPPEWGRHVAATLTQAYAFEYPGVGHGSSSVVGCPMDMLLAFLSDSEGPPDDACIAEMGPAVE